VVVDGESVLPPVPSGATKEIVPDAFRYAICVPSGDQAGQLPLTLHAEAVRVATSNTLIVEPSPTLYATFDPSGDGDGLLDAVGMTSSSAEPSIFARETQ
jgi:hypothetical protein